MPTLKQRIEDNIVVVFLSALATGFWGWLWSHAALPNYATAAAWMAKSECPAVPVVLQLKVQAMERASTTKNRTLKTSLIVSSSKIDPEN